MTPLALAALATAAGAVVLTWTWVPAGGRALLRSTARKADLAPPVHAGGQVVRRLQERTAAATVGLVAGFWLAVAVVPPDPAPGDAFVTPVAFPLAMGAGFVGMAVAAAVYALVATRRTPVPDALLGVLLASRPARHFRRRLWPQEQDAAADVGARS